MTTSSPPQSATEADLPFRQVAQDLPTPCWISDAEGTIIWVNAAWLAYTGLSVETIQATGLEALHDPAVLPRVRERWIEARQHGQPVEMTFPLKGKDGGFRPFLTKVVPLRDASGRVARWFGTNTDVSEQSRIEAELRESQRRLELATEAAELGIWDWNLADDTFVYSLRAREICGFPRDQQITLADVVGVTHPDDYPRTSAMAQRALDPAIKSIEKYRYRIVQSDGEVRTVEANGRAVFELMPDGSERAIRYVGTLLDITEVTELAESSRETEAVLNSLFDASELYIAVLEVTEDSFTYILANRATLAFYNQPADTATFDARDIGMPREELARWRDNLLEVWKSGQPRTMEYAFDGGQGLRWYLGTYTPLPQGPAGRPRVSFVVIDVTAKKHAEDRQALLMREVDHRAKNALAVAQAIVQLTQADSVDAFRSAVKGRMAALARVHTLLADERWDSADLRRLVSEELEPYIADRPDCATTEGPNFGLAPAVAQTIGLVLHELVTNAAKHGALSRADGHVHVSWALANESDLTLTWRETFKPSGLAVSRRGFGFTMLEQSIKKQLGGQWRMDWLDDGLIYSIDLPKTRVAQSPTRESIKTEGGRRVLIVEDEPLIALALSDELTALGFSVTGIAHNLSEARSLLSDQQFDIALVDLNLGGESTVELSRELIRAGSKVIFCTGYQSPNLPQDLSSAPVLTKPISTGNLQQALDVLKLD